MASKMASVTLEVKINNQSCKQRKRRGRSSGKQVTNEKHIGDNQVKQKRVTDRPVQAEVRMQGVNHTMLSRTAHWERAQKDFSTCSAWRDLDLFSIFYFWAISPFHTCIHYLLDRCWYVCCASLLPKDKWLQPQHFLSGCC